MIFMVQCTWVAAAAELGSISGRGSLHFSQPRWGHLSLTAFRFSTWEESSPGDPANHSGRRLLAFSRQIALYLLVSGIDPWESWGWRGWKYLQEVWKQQAVAQPWQGSPWPRGESLLIVKGWNLPAVLQRTRRCIFPPTLSGGFCSLKCAISGEFQK